MRERQLPLQDINFYKENARICVTQDIPAAKESLNFEERHIHDRRQKGRTRPAER